VNDSQEVGFADEKLLGFKRHLRPEVVPGEGTYLFSERNVTAIRGAQLEQIAPLLDGTRDLPTLLSHVPQDDDGHTFERLVGRLSQAGMLEWRTRDAVCDQQSVAAEVYWNLAGLDSAQAQNDSTTGRVRLLALDGVNSHHAADVFAAAGLRLWAQSERSVQGGATADLTVVLCSDYLADSLAEVDEEHRAAQRPWLLARPVGSELWVGPVFQPGGACWHCLAHRLRGHRQAEVHVQRALGRSGPAPRPLSGLPALEGIGLQMAALEAVKWLAGYRYSGQQSVWTLDTLSLQGARHPLTPRPQCSACGDPGLVAARVSRPVVPHSRPKASSSGHRAVPPEQVLERYRHLVSPVTGVVKAIQRDRRGPAFLNSYRSGPNAAVSNLGLGDIRSTLRGENGGKGVTALHAEVSALCEALERHSAQFYGDEPRVRATYADLGDAAVHPDACQLFHKQQFHDRNLWNARRNPIHQVAEPIGPDTAIDWTPVWSLTEQRQRLLPTSLLYFHSPDDAGRPYVYADSNGNASGSSLEDALVHGFFELVERDAASIWWYNRTRQPGIDLGAFCDPWIEELRSVYAGLQREVWALDLTSDFHIPTFVALSRCVGHGPENIMLGFGTHFDPATALRRALSELNQMLPYVMETGPGGKGYSTTETDLVQWWSKATVANQPYLLPDQDTEPRVPWDYSYVPRLDLKDDIDAIVALTRAHGMDLMVLDQTRPDIGLPVVKVIVPGLRHFRARFAPGRLYDIPVELGLLPSPTTYDELNPVPMFV
jgi:oxazoline/thiazoline synthase